MPFLIELAIEGFFSLGLSWAAATALTSAIVSLGGPILLGSISKLFAKGSSSSSLASQIASRTVISRQADEPFHN